MKHPSRIRGTRADGIFSNPKTKKTLFHSFTFTVYAWLCQCTVDLLVNGSSHIHMKRGTDSTAVEDKSIDCIIDIIYIRDFHLFEQHGGVPY